MVLSSCGVPTYEEERTEELEEEHNQTSEVIESVESEVTEEVTVVDGFLQEPLSFESFADALEVNEIEFIFQAVNEEITDVLRVQGYVIADEVIELYEFEENNERFQVAVETGELEMAVNETVPVAINGNFVLMLNNHELSGEILEVFHQFEAE